MRDGVRLHTRIFVPKEQDGPLPFFDAPDPLRHEERRGQLRHVPEGAGRRGLHLRLPGPPRQIRVRGGLRHAAAGARTRRHDALDEGTDTYDTIDWLLKNVPANNGRVGMLGVSYLGWTTIMGGLEPHPALKAISPQASPGRHVARRRLPPQRRVPAQLRLRVRLRARERQGPQALRLRPPRHLRLVPRARPAGECRRAVLPRQDPDLERLRGPPRLRRVLEAPDDDPPHPRTSRCRP